MRLELELPHEMKVYICIALALIGLTPARAENWKLTTTMRTRLELYDFFEAPGFENRYEFVGNLVRFAATKSSSRRDSIVELAAPALLGLPENAVAPGARGQLGLGATYFVANRGQDASVFLKQAAVTFKKLDSDNLAIKAGRFEFVEGQEVLTGDPVLDLLKRERIAHRLIGNFGFTHVQRSFDGLVLTRDAGKNQLTLMAGLPTVGVYDLDGMQTIEDVHVVYGAYNFRLPAAEKADARLFLIDYADARDVLKVDNRGLRARQLDSENVHVTTAGGHALKRLGDTDLLAWGVVQGGDWGVLDHRAWAFALEAGRQWPKRRWKPWLRAGVNRASGDDNPADGKHGTFFEVLPTPRIYARYPFFNPMNLNDAFVSLTVKPRANWTLRADVHDLHLTEANDLWYAAGGAFDRNVFGYAGRPSGGFSDLGTLVDASLDWKLDPRTTLTLYHGQHFGGEVIRSTFPDGDDAGFGYIEVTHRF